MIPTETGIPAVTVVISRRVRPGREAEFRVWAEGIHAVMATHAGFRSGQVVPPVEETQPDWVFVNTFDSPQNLRLWLTSADRRVWMARAEPLLASQGPARVTGGLEQLFGLPPASEAPLPPVWKVAVSVIMGLFPLTVLVYQFLTPVIKSLPLVPRAFASAVIVGNLMTWVVMPGVTRLLKPWLYPKPG